MDWKHWRDTSNLRQICRDDTCTVYEIKDDSGEGLITKYQVFPGCCIVYNDFHMKSWHCGKAPDSNLLCIDHCREGRVEWDRGPNHCVYVAAGDLQVDCRPPAERDFFFPLKHYHGLSVGVDLQCTDNGVLHLMDDFSVDLEQLKKKFCPENQGFIMRSSQRINHIFLELYNTPEKNRNAYFKIKLMELFFFLDSLDVPAGGEVRPYFHRSQVEKIKQMVELQTANLSHWYTLEELSGMFGFPMTGLKSCFKGMYGCTMAEYMKNFRMNAAAELLRTTSTPVIEIAAAMGYENPGKFSAAFRSVLGQTPTQYRKGSF